MGREVRKVPANWEHPKNEKDYYIPLYNGSFSKDAAEWDENKEQWDKGYYRVLNDGKWKPKDSDMNETFEDWSGQRPEEKDYMPDWSESEQTHYQMYENVTEGTPISTPMETPKILARWLSDNEASASGDETATYEEWLAMIEGDGYAPTMVLIPGKGLMSGVRAIAEEKTNEPN